MSERRLHVVIVGGGIGGLCLAQGLRRAGVSVAVYERDRTAIGRADQAREAKCRERGAQRGGSRGEEDR